MKKAIGIITQSCLIADFYRGILEELFDDIAEIFTYSLDNGTLRELKECDLYVRAITAGRSHTSRRRNGRSIWI